MADQDTPENKQTQNGEKILAEPYDIFMHKFNVLPLWFKEVLLIDAYKNFDEKQDIPGLYKGPLMQKIVPKLTFIGKRELQKKEMGLGADIYRFLRQVATEKDITQITLSNFWTLEKTAHSYSLCYAKELLEVPGNAQTPVDFAYIGGEIKFGEYLKRLGIVDVEQLKQVLDAQKKETEKGVSVPIGKIFTRMGFVSEEAITHILMLKKDAKKVVLLPICDSEKCTAMPELFNLKQVNAKMMREIKELRTKVKTLSEKE